MPIFTRRATAPTPQSDYTKYRTHVREDFLACCAYCLLSELAAHGEEGFELDHFRPKSRPEFAHLATDFFNLYYACHPCNRYKSARWPTRELLDAGFRFVDPCSDLFGEHFVNDSDGTWRPTTPAGRYTSEKLRLNRSHLIEIRSLLNAIADARQMPRLDWNAPSRDAIAALLKPE